MNTVVEIAPTRNALIREVRASFEGAFNFQDDAVKVEYYTLDERIGWDTHIVVIDGYGVWGFTDGPVAD